MPITHDSPECELRQTIARLQAEIATLRAQSASRPSSSNEQHAESASHHAQRVEAFYRVPKISPFFKAGPYGSSKSKLPFVTPVSRIKLQWPIQ